MKAYGLMVRDGVTAALELEVGTGNVAEWYAARDGGQIVNYGVSIGHIPVRMIVMEDGGEFLPSGAANSQAADPAQIDEMARRIGEGLAQGAVAVGFGIAYTQAASVGRYRAQGGGVIIHSRTEEMTLAAISNPLTMIASDGIIDNGKGHPRSTGTYAKVLGRYVRELGVLDLMDALRRMTIAPAERLQERVPAMTQKGRIRTGADADLTIFDPATVIDRSTYTEPAIPSEGIEYVLVNGVVVVDHGELVEGVRPGKAVRSGG